MNTNEANFYMGGTQVVGIYLGSTPIWSSEPDVIVYDANEDSTGYTFPTDIIPNWKFSDNPDIVAVEIGSRITHIGDNDASYVFAGCHNLSAVTIGPNVEYIGGRAFESTGLVEVTIPASVTSIDTNAFYNFNDSCTITFEGPCPSFSMEEDGDLGFGTHIVVPDAYLSDYCDVLCCTGGKTLHIESDEGNECDCECQSCGEQGLCDDGEGNCIPCEECPCGDDGEGNCTPCE